MNPHVARDLLVLAVAFVVTASFLAVAYFAAYWAEQARERELDRRAERIDRRSRRPQA